MIWIYIGIIIFVIQLYVLTHTYTIKSTEYCKHRIDFNRAEKLGVPVWLILLLALCSSTPVINILGFIVFWAIWLKYYCEPEDIYKSWYTYWILKDKILSRKI